jgi:hypothetical protein
MESLLFKATNNLTHQTPLNAIRLDHNVSSDDDNDELELVVIVGW